jgi:hypothetical protein
MNLNTISLPTTKANKQEDGFCQGSTRVLIHAGSFGSWQVTSCFTIKEFKKSKDNTAKEI